VDRGTLPVLSCRFPRFHYPISFHYKSPNPFGAIGAIALIRGRNGVLPVPTGKRGSG